MSIFIALREFSRLLRASGKLSARTLPTMGELFEGRPGCEIFELQYHGELVFSRDVQSIDLMTRKNLFLLIDAEVVA